MTEKSGLPFVTLLVVRELLETQERCFKATMQMLIDSIRHSYYYLLCIREEVKDIRNTVTELKESLTLSQKDIDDAKSNIRRLRQRSSRPMKTSVKHMATLSISWIDKSFLKTTVEEITSKFLACQKRTLIMVVIRRSGRNAKQLLKREPYKVNPESMVIERAHRVGKRRDPFHHLADGTKVKSRPRPIVAKFLSWKDKDRMLR